MGPANVVDCVRYDKGPLHIWDDIDVLLHIWDEIALIGKTKRYLGHFFFRINEIWVTFFPENDGDWKLRCLKAILGL